MSGHSKWSNIKRKKEKTDGQKAKVYTKIGREIAVAVKSGGPDPSINGKLKDLIAKARANNMPAALVILGVLLWLIVCDHWLILAVIVLAAIGFLWLLSDCGW